MRRNALLITSLSIILLVFVTVDIFALKNKSKEVEKAELKANLVEKVNEIGQVLGDESGQVLPGSIGGSYYKFYLKDQSGTAINYSESVDKSLIKGATVIVSNKSSFTCGDGGANYTFTESDGKYFIICNESASMSVRISKSGYNTKNTTVAVYSGEIPTIYLTRYVAPPPPPPPETIKNVTMPSEFTETGGSTNLSAIPDPAKVESLTLDTNSNTIKYKEVIDLSSTDTKDKFKTLDTYVKADEKGVVGVDSANLAALNKSASITMKSLGYVKTPKVLVDGKEDKSIVSNVVYKDGTLTFDVTHFSTFTAAPTVGINEPADNFETTDKTIKLRGTVSDPTASVSAKLNNKDLGKLKVATTGAFEKEITLDEGLNKIVVSALTTNLATASATVSGTLNALPSYVWQVLILLILGALGIAGLIYGIKKMRKGKSNPEAPKSPAPTSNPPSQ